MKNLLKVLLLLLTILYSRQDGIFAQDLAGHIGPRYSVGREDPANGIYVSPTGDDATANGTKDRPYKSINTALGKADVGATIILRGGTYKERRDVRVRKSNITIKSAIGEWAVIDLTEYDPGNEEHSAVMFHAENQITGGNVTGCKLQSVEVVGGYYAVCFDTQWEYGKGDTRGAADIIVEDCILHHSRNDVVKVKPNCTNITIRYNEIYNSGQEFIPSNQCTPDGRGNAEGIDCVNGTKLLIHNNYIHHICTNGIYAKGGATDALIENNLIENIEGAGILVGFDTSPQYFDTALNPQYYENIRGVVRNNLVINTVLSGIGLYAAKDAEVYNNTLVNVNTHGSYHSAIYFGITYQDDKTHPGRPASVNPAIHHNIVSQPASFTNPMIDIRYDKDYPMGSLSALDGMPTMHDNCYYVTGKSATFNDNRPTAETNMGLAAWKTHIDGDSGTLEVNPALDDDYLPANPQCSGMGILSKKVTGTTGNVAPVFQQETVAYLYNNMLWIENPVAETVQGYSLAGTLLFSLQKPAGKIGHFVHQPKGTMMILRGNSGWTKKIVVP